MPKILIRREQWLDKGLEAFSRAGLDGLNIEKMASALGCAKSSFYWYFSDRTSYVNQLVEHWFARDTESFIVAGNHEAAPAERLSRLYFHFLDQGIYGDFLFFLRRLGQQDKGVRTRIESVEKLRVEFVENTLREMGIEPERSAQLAVILYHNFLGWYERHKTHRITRKMIIAEIQAVSQNFGIRLPILAAKRMVIERRKG